MESVVMVGFEFAPALPAFEFQFLARIFPAQVFFERKQRLVVFGTQNIAFIRPPAGIYSRRFYGVWSKAGFLDAVSFKACFFNFFVYFFLKIRIFCFMKHPCTDDFPVYVFPVRRIFGHFPADCGFRLAIYFLLVHRI